MRIGIQLPETERLVPWSELSEMATTIEQLGFDSIWVGDHLLYRDETGRAAGPWEAWTTLAALAAVTERVQIGPLVAATAFHNPVMLAKLASTVDEISGGRLVLGVGAGWNRLEFEAYGFPYDRRVSRFIESFEIIRRLLAGETFDFDGSFFCLRGAELAPPPKPGGPPLMIGSNGSRMLQATLAHAASWNSWFEDFGNRPEALPPLLDKIDSACEAVGRDPATLEKTVAVLVQYGTEPQRRNDSNPIVGSASEVADVLHRFGSIGVSHVQLVLDPIDLDSIGEAGLVLDLLRSPP